jgi:cupin fold WbuC family metalloprotein
MKWIKESEEVFYPKQSRNLVTLSKQDTEYLQTAAQANVRNRSRVCTHLTIEEDIHEMVIYHPKGTYVRPHKHRGKDESFHLISGEIDLVIFDEGGNVVESLPMGDYSSGKIFYYRISANTFHTQIVRKDTIFHEVTKGPFDKRDNVAADWSPDERNTLAIQKYSECLKKRLSNS